MVRRYIKDMCLRWQKLYGVDGFRFDLMGIIDIETLNPVSYTHLNIFHNTHLAFVLEDPLIYNF